MPEKLTDEEFTKRYGNKSIVLSDEEFTKRYEPELKTTPEQKSIGGFLSNIPASAGRLIEPLLHPIDTATNIGKTAIGAVSAMTPEQYKSPAFQGQEQQFRDVATGLKQRYGGLSNIAETAYQDPVGMAADAAALLSGGAGAASRLPGRIGKIASATAKVGKALDPLQAGFKAGGLILGPAGKYASEILGITTGRGGETVRQAAKGTEAFTEKMRGGGFLTEVVDDLKSALQNIRNERGNQYRAKLDIVKADVSQLALQPVYEEMKRQFKEFNIKVRPPSNPGDSPTLDFSRSTISESADQVRVSGEFRELLSWGTKPGDLTPAGVDTLKRRLDNFYSDTSAARALVAGINKSVRGVLDSVPGYSEMVKDYETATKMIKEMEGELSAGKGTLKGTAVRKIINVYNQSNDYRKTLLEALDKYSGKGLVQEIAGVGMSSWMPTGIMRPLLGGGLVAGAAAGGVNPAALFALTTSPRIVGEVARMTGKVARGVTPVTGSAAAKAPFYRPASIAAQKYDYDTETKQLVPTGEDFIRKAKENTRR